MNMRRIYLSLAITILILISLNFVSACAVIEENQVVVIFPSDAGINIDVLESYCAEDTCQINSDRIVFEIEHQRHNMIFAVISSKDVMSLSIKFLDETPGSEELKELTSLGLRLLIANNIIYGISAKDVKEISEIVAPGNMVYFKSSSCGNSYIDKINSDESKDGWLLADHTCIVEGFSGTCLKIRSVKGCGWNFSLANINLLPLTLTNAPISKYTDFSEENYWVIGLIIVLILMIILFLIKKKKSK